MSRIRAALLHGLFLFFVVLIASNHAQEGKITSKSEAFRLPIHYGMVGVSDAQREKLIAIHNSYEDKLAELRKQLKMTVEERDAAMEGALTEGQRLRLKELREEAKRKTPKGLQPQAATENLEK